jgi:hypothetical protein
MEEGGITMRGKISLLLAGIMILSIAGTAFAAEVTTFGDVRFRPRYEQTTSEDNTTGAGTTEKVKTDMKLLYRGRVGVKAKWDNGFSGKVKLAVNAVANNVTMPTTGVNNIMNLEEASLSWKKDAWKLTGGRIMCKGYAKSVVLDCHTNPTLPIDTPFADNNRAILDGMTVDYAASDQVDLTGAIIHLANESNTTYSGPTAPADDEDSDQNAVGVLATIKLDALKLMPGIVMTMASTQGAQPQATRTTYGLNAEYKLDEVKLCAGIGMTAAEADEDGDATTVANHMKEDTMLYEVGAKYNGFSLMVDMATYTAETTWDAVAGDWADDTATEQAQMNIMVAYDYKPAKGVKIQPRLKYRTREMDDDTSATFDKDTRIRFEVTCDAKF